MENQSPETQESQMQSPEELAANCNTEVAEFFEMDEIGGIKVINCPTKEELIKVWLGYNPDKKQNDAPDYLVAFSPDKDIYILSTDTMPPYQHSEVSGPERYKMVLKHELVHKYLSKIPGAKVSWLEEGTCSHIANQPYPKWDEADITAGLLRDLSHTKDGRKYAVGKNIVDRIVGEYGKEKLFEIIKMEDREERNSELQRMFPWLK